ncbi:MAG: radical SAM protein [Candidatus Omnitrophota bacterium]
MKIKILLSSALLNAEDMFGQYSKGAGAYLPHGLLSIASVLRKHGHDVSICDPYAMGMDEAAYKSYLIANKFDIIGLGNCYTSQTDNYFTTAKICKEVLPNTKICIGGAHPTLFAQETLERCPYIDFAVRGEGECQFLKLTETLSNDDFDFSIIEGLVFRSKDGIRSNVLPLPIENIDDIPLFPYHLLHMDKYIPPPSNYKQLPTYGMLVQRGCPYGCVYCDSRIHGKKLRQISIKRAIEEIKFLCDYYGMKGVIFHDSVFTINRNWVMSLCEKLLENKINIHWSCYTRCDLVDNELCRLMKKAGCWNISLGIESANQASLDLIKKNITVSQIVCGIEAVHNAGIETIGSVILCLPGEDETMVKNTIHFVKAMNIDFPVFFMPVPFPGTELYDLCKQDGGLIENIDWADYRQWMDQKNPLYINPKIGKEKMIALYQHAFRTFYLSPKYILKSFRKIRTLSDFKKYFRGFCSIKGLFGISIKSPFLSMRD